MTNIISTKISIFRNLKDYKFMPKLEADKAKEIEAKVDANLSGFTKITPQTSNEHTKNFLMQTKLLNPKAKAVYLNKDNVAVNLLADEHLTIVASCPGFDEKLSQKANLVVSALESKLSMAYSDQYGYLTSDIKNIGSAVQVESLISLPGLIEMGKINQVCQNMKNLGYDIERADKTTYKLATVCALGLTSSEVFTEFGKVITKLNELELESEKMLYTTNADEITDKVQRANAILTCAHMLNFDELRSHLTSLRIGANLGIINTKQTQIDALQSIVDGKVGQFVTKQEQLDLAEKVTKILKGE